MSTMPLWLDIVVAALLLSGAAFALIGSLGLLRFSDFMRRLHGPTKATTLGVGNILLAVILIEAWKQQSFSLRELMISGFALMTAPVSAMLLARAWMRNNTQTMSEPDPTAQPDLTEANQR